MVTDMIHVYQLNLELLAYRAGGRDSGCAVRPVRLWNMKLVQYKAAW